MADFSGRPHGDSNPGYRRERAGDARTYTMTCESTGSGMDHGIRRVRGRSAACPAHRHYRREAAEGYLGLREQMSDSMSFYLNVRVRNKKRWREPLSFATPEMHAMLNDRMSPTVVIPGRRKRQSGPAAVMSKIAALYAAQQGLCFLCGEPMLPIKVRRQHRSWSREHVVPQSKRGLPGDIVLSHAMCNCERADDELNQDALQRAREIQAEALRLRYKG